MNFISLMLAPRWSLVLGPPKSEAHASHKLMETDALARMAWGEVQSWLSSVSRESYM